MRTRITAALVLAGALASGAWASDVIVPESSDAVSPLFVFNSGRNESSNEVRAHMAEIRDQKAVSAFLEPKRATQIDRLMEIAQVRLQIAEKREERDRLRKKRRTKRQTNQLDREIDVLKERLVKMSPSAPQKGFWANLMNPDGE
jgi:hypothetical protein